MLILVGAWVAIHGSAMGIRGLGVVAAAGLVVYGAIMAIAFRAGAWRRRE